MNRVLRRTLLPVGAASLFLLGVAAGDVAFGAVPVRQLVSVPVAVRALALTFDDGPSPLYTPAVLALLQQHRARATFFVIGQELVRYPQIARQAAVAGMELGNHGFNHLALTGLDPTAIRAEAAPVERELTAITGSRPTLYRLPQGRGDARALRALADLGYTVVSWSIDPRDWAGGTAASIAALVGRQARPGSIVLLHDGGGDRSATVGAVRLLLPALAAQGYRIVTVSQLLELARTRA